MTHRACDESCDLQQDPNETSKRPTTSKRINCQLLFISCYLAQLSLSPSQPSQTIAAASAPHPSPFDCSLSICLFSCGCPLPPGPAVCVRRQLSFPPVREQGGRKRTGGVDRANAKLAPFQCRQAWEPHCGAKVPVSVSAVRCSEDT